VCRGALFGAILLLSASLAPREISADELEEEDALPVRVPGLIAVYTHPATNLEFTRYEPIPAWNLARGQAPDPRLPPIGWRVRYRGVLEILRPGKYQFAVTATGRVALSLAGKSVPIVPSSDLQQAAHFSPGVELALGLNRIEVEYEPAADAPARLQFQWQSEGFIAEPLPSRALGHEAHDQPVVDSFAAGRLAVEEHSCVACHRADDRMPLSKQLATRSGPRLTAAGSRLKAGWIYHWLANPAAQRPEAVMPRLFADNERGAAERYAVAKFLAAEGAPLEIVSDPPAEVIQQTATEGAKLFQQMGCAVCHQRQGDRPARVILRGLSQKTTPEVIEAFLQKPEATAPAGRMPAFRFGKLDRRRLAMHLVHQDAAQTPALALPPAPNVEILQAAFAESVTDDERAKFAQLSAEQQVTALGRQVMRARNCAACHDFTPAGEQEPWNPVNAPQDMRAIAAKPEGGCLAPSTVAGEVQRAPRFGEELERPVVAAFLRSALGAPATGAPGQDAALALARFNCLACHERDGIGGLTAEYINQLGSGQDAAGESVSPPSLTQVTAKLTGKTLHGVLEADERARPWMSLQMPRFGRAPMSSLPEQLAVLDAQTLAESSTTPAGAPAIETDAAAAEIAEAGRTLVGSRGFGCTKCHDMLGVPSTGTRGPDLAQVTARINNPWYLRWMHDPQRIQMGTRMPTVFLNGESPYKDILAGDPARQRDAIWQYLAVARSLPPPEGLEPQKLQTLAAGKRPLAIRTFLPGTTPRGIAIRFPNEVNVAFDAQMGRLAYAWSGGFLDLGPVWNGRGGHPAHVLGKIFWTAPAGCPWEFTPPEASPPSVAGRAEDPALGALVKDHKLHSSRLTFLGYRVDDVGPTLRYRLALAGDRSAVLTERVAAVRNATAVGIVREVTMTTPPDMAGWFLAAEAEEAPQWCDVSGAKALQSGEQHDSASGAVQIKHEGQPLLLHVRGAPSSTVWLVEKQNERWQVFLKLSPAAATADRTVTFAVLGPAGDVAETWQQLVAEELK